MRGGQGGWRAYLGVGDREEAGRVGVSRRWSLAQPRGPEAPTASQASRTSDGPHLASSASLRFFSSSSARVMPSPPVDLGRFLTISDEPRPPPETAP